MQNTPLFGTVSTKISVPETTKPGTDVAPDEGTAGPGSKNGKGTGAGSGESDVKNWASAVAGTT